MAAGRRGPPSGSDAIELVLRLCEQDEPVIAGAVIGECFSAVGPQLIGWGMLRAAPNLRVVTCRACHGDHPAELEFDPANRAYRHLCPEAGGWVEVAAADLLAYELDIEALLERLALGVGVPPGRRPVCLIDGLLWDLGEARAGSRLWTVLFGRRLSLGAGFDAVIDALATRAGKDPGLLFTSSTELGSRLPLPGGHRVMPLRDCLVMTYDGMIVEQRVVLANLDAPARGPHRSGLPGRPSSKHLVLAEHRRRLASGEAHCKVADEAKELEAWLRRAHPSEPAAKWTSIRNTISPQHRARPHQCQHGAKRTK